MSTFPMLSMFLSDEMIEKVTNLFKGELEDFLQASAQGLAENGRISRCEKFSEG